MFKGGRYGQAAGGAGAGHHGQGEICSLPLKYIALEHGVRGGITVKVRVSRSVKACPQGDGALQRLLQAQQMWSSMAAGAGAALRTRTALPCTSTAAPAGTGAAKDASRAVHSRCMPLPSVRRTLSGSFRGPLGRALVPQAQTVSLVYRHTDGADYLLNLIDTPGHVDFSYEARRACAAPLRCACCACMPGLHLLLRPAQRTRMGCIASHAWRWCGQPAWGSCPAQRAGAELALPRRMCCSEAHHLLPSLPAAVRPCLKPHLCATTGTCAGLPLSGGVPGGAAAGGCKPRGAGAPPAVLPMWLTCR